MTPEDIAGAIAAAKAEELDEYQMPAETLPTPTVDVRRGANWTPPTPMARCFLSPVGSETCMFCGKHIARHYGATEYRCDPRAEETP